MLTNFKGFVGGNPLNTKVSYLNRKGSHLIGQWDFNLGPGK